MARSIERPFILMITVCPEGASYPPLQFPYKHRTVASRCLSHFGFILLFGYSLDLVRQYTRHPAVHFDASVIVWAVMFAASPRSSAESNVSATRPISCPR